MGVQECFCQSIMDWLQHCPFSSLHMCEPESESAAPIQRLQFFSLLDEILSRVFVVIAFYQCSA